MVSSTTTRPRLPAELRPDQVTAIIDTREQRPLDLAPLATITGTLNTGDYSVVGLETIIAVERKELSDLLGCVGTERERFEREVLRLLAYPVRCLVVESTWSEIEAAEWRSKITAAAAVGSLLGWMAMGLPIIMAGDHQRAGRFVAKMLFTAARRRWREARALVAPILAPGESTETDCVGAP
jgi:ERCC4-type nuclease